MNITHRRLNRVDVVGVEGRLTAAEAPELQARLNQLFNEGRYRILLDFANLEYISSPGLRVLIEARKRAHHRMTKPKRERHPEGRAPRCSCIAQARLEG